MINWVVFTMPGILVPSIALAVCLIAVIFNIYRLNHTEYSESKSLYMEYIVIGLLVALIMAIIAFAEYRNELEKYELTHLYEEAYKAEIAEDYIKAYSLYEEIYNRSPGFMAEGEFSHVKEGMERSYIPSIYARGMEAHRNGDCLEAIQLFIQIRDYEDSQHQADLCMIAYLELTHPEWFPTWGLTE